MWRKRKPSSPASCGRSGLISSLRTSAASGGHVRLVGRERLDGAAVEDLAFDRASLEHAPLGRLELVEACCEQRLQGGRNDHLAVRLAGHRHHLLRRRAGCRPPRGRSRSRSSLADVRPG